MRKILTFAALAAMNSALLAGPALAQGTPQNVSLVKVDVTKLATGFRASKVIGSTVVNDHDDTVGKVDDIIVSPDGKAPFVVLSVGGFLGMGTHYVALPYESLKINQDKITLPGATKDALKKLPEFNYAK